MSILFSPFKQRGYVLSQIFKTNEVWTTTVSCSNVFLSLFGCKFSRNCTGSLSKNICVTPLYSILFRTQPEMRRRMWEWCGLKTSSSQTKGKRPSWPNWIMGDVVRMLVSLSLYQPLTNLIIRALASVWGRKGAFSGSTQELEGWAPDS